MRVRGCSRLGIAAMLVLLADGLIGAAPVSAHLRSGTVAVDYRATLQQSQTRAYAAGIYQSDRGLSMRLKPGHVVVIVGYLGEPVFRLDATGLWVNAASPTAAVVGVLKKADRVAAPSPHWRIQRGRNSVSWHDGRVQGLPRGVQQGTWAVPLIVDGRAGRLRGELQRFAAPAPWLWLGLLAALLVAGASPLLLRRPDLIKAAAIAFALMAASASIVSALAFALDRYASPGTWIVGLDEIAFLAVGLAMLFRGPRNLHAAAAIGVGLVSTATGLLVGDVFLHPIVLATLPGPLVRILVITTIGAGVSAAGLGILHYVENSPSLRELERELGFSGIPGR